MPQSLIFDIKRFAINDGPGIRTTVFFKGCPLNCVWCHNPESISKYAQRMFSKSKCMQCYQCIDACYNGTLSLVDSEINVNTELCKICGNCMDVCPTRAIELSGETMTVEEVVQIIKNESLLMEQSGGGVTFSGGEPLMHSEMLTNLLEECAKENIHRAVDTSGYARPDVLLQVAELTDLFLYDLKIMDSEKHKEYIGVPNEIILSNLKLLSINEAKINIRLPLIKGINDDDKNIDATARFISSLDGEKKHVNILPYHNIALNKYKKLNLPCKAIKLTQPEDEKLDYILGVFESYGLDALIGG